jgi:hypothetical protein
MTDQKSVKNVLGAAFGLLSHARVREIDLGNSEIVLLSAMEEVWPGVAKRLRRLSPAPDIKPSRYAKRQTRRIAQVHPIKGKTMHGRKANSLR